MNHLLRTLWLTGIFVVAYDFTAYGVDSVAHPDEIAVGLERPLKLSLNGDWTFQRDPDQVGETEHWFEPGKIQERTVKVPLPWQLADEELIPYRGTAWYQRTFRIPDDFAGKRVALCFSGVDNKGKVWIDGKFAGEHEGAQPPFQLEITDLVRPGRDHVVTVKVSDPAAGTSYFMDTHSLIGVSGLWRDVWIEATGQRFIANVFMIPDIDRSQATAELTVYIPSDDVKPLKANITVTGPDGKTATVSGDIGADLYHPGGFVTKRLTIDLGDPALWHVDHPHLYHVDATLSDSSGVIDEVDVDFGMRKLHTKDGRIYLNNQVLYIVGGGLDPGPFGGAVDVNWHVPPPYAYPTDEEIQSDIRKTKSLGVNFVRVPLRPMHPRFLYWADRMGLLVMQGGPWTPTEGIQATGGLDEYMKSWSKIVLRDRNHPSVALWELFNESFGIGHDEFKVISGKLYDHVKHLDPTRFILDNAGGAYLNELNYIGNHGKTDIEDVHSYPGFPMFFFAEGSEMRYPATSRDYWLAIRWQKYPVLVTEFAPSPYVYNAAKVREKWGGREPWWFNAKQVQSAMPAQWDLNGYEERFYRWNFDKIYGSFTAYTEASDWYSFWGTKYYTQLMRMNPEISGWVCWLFDGAPHPVGQIDYFHDIKVFGDELAKIWTQDIVIVDETRRNYWEGENLYANVHVSHFSQKEVKNARVEWAFEGTDVKGEIAGITMAPGDAGQVGNIVFRIPAVSDSQVQRLTVRLLSDTGEVLSENYERIQVYPRSYRSPDVKEIAGYGLQNHRFAVLGYDVRSFNPESTDSVVLVSQMHFDNQVKAFLQRGGTAILLICESPDYWERGTLPRILPVEQDLKKNGLFLGRKFQGGHSDSFYARKGLGIFDRIPYENPYAFQFAKVWPRRVIGALKSDQWNDVLAGAHGNLFRSIPRDSMAKTSWEEVSGTLVQFKVGKGRLLISTFNLVLPMLDDPVAAVLLNDLVKYASGDFEPGHEFIVD